MDAVAAVTERIAQIRSQIATVSLLAPGHAPRGVLGTPTGTPGSGAVNGPTGSSDGGFDAALQTAVAGHEQAAALTGAMSGGPRMLGGPAPFGVGAGGAPFDATSGAAVGAMPLGPTMLGRAAPARWENPAALAALTGVGGAATGPGAAPGTAGPVGAVGAVGAVGPVGGTTVVGSGKALVDAKGVPVELRVHGNGRVPASALSAVEGLSGHRLWTPAARSLEALRAAAAQDGIRIGVTDSYRPYDVQVDLVRRKGLYSQGGLAAVPGTSDHGWGIAVDLDLNAAAQAWMRTHGGRFGFVEDVPREPWHWSYRPTH